MKYLIIIAALLLAGCNDETSLVYDPQDQIINDQCLRREILKECMTATPAGPVATKYNDWDEVVAQCRNEAYYSSKRKRRVVKPECEGP